MRLRARLPPSYGDVAVGCLLLFEKPGERRWYRTFKFKAFSCNRVDETEHVCVQA